jgi:acetyl esterase/lipase
MMARREILGLLGSISAGTLLATPRTALIDAFRRKSDGIDAKFEARTHKSDWVMPYRLFRPQAAGKLPLVIYLHGSGGLGGDNVKQMGSGKLHWSSSTRYAASSPSMSSACTSSANPWAAPVRGT